MCWIQEGQSLMPMRICLGWWAQGTYSSEVSNANESIYKFSRMKGSSQHQFFVFCETACRNTDLGEQNFLSSRSDEYWSLSSNLVPELCIFSIYSIRVSPPPIHPITKPARIHSTFLVFLVSLFISIRSGDVHWSIPGVDATPYFSKSNDILSVWDSTIHPYLFDESTCSQ